MANALQSHWVLSARTDLVASRIVLHRRAPAHPATGIHSASSRERWTGCKHAGLSRQPMLCRAVAAAEPAQQQLDVTKMAPLGDRLLVKPQEEAKTTSGGLLLSSGTTKPIQEALIGVVLAVGEDVDINVKVGSKVLFSKYSSSDVKVPDGDVSFVAQKSILATLS
ncbi:hypothetical protein WJX77_011331 [Trebouxia sp. C0004]